MRLHKYIDEKASRKQALQKVKDTIKSLDSKDQIQPAYNMIKSFLDMYDKGFLADLRDILQDMGKGAAYKTLVQQLTKKYKDLKG